MLSGIELLSGTWEGVIEGLRYLCLSKLRLLSKLTHRGGALFRPLGTGARDHDAEPELLEETQFYVVYGGFYNIRHPCFDSTSDPEVAVGCYLDMFSDNDLEQTTVTSRQLGIELPRNYRRT